MDFDLTDEQVLLKNSVERLLADRCPFDARRKLVASDVGWNRETWALLAEQGLLAAPFDEADGGLGGGPVELMILGEAFGRSLLAEPFLASIVLGGVALRACADATLRAELTPPVTAGERLLAFADDEAGARSSEARPNTKAGLDGGVWRLSGTKTDVLHGASADLLAVSAATPNGTALFLVETAAPGVSARGYRTFDGLRAAEIRFDNASAQAVLAGPETALDVLAKVRQAGIAYMAAEAVGLCDMALAASVDHIKTRKQFGQTLASFQALKHRAAEMMVQLEQLRSMAIYAAAMLTEPDPLEREKAFAAVKAVVGAAGVQIGQAAVQMHGGVGVTEEYRVGWALRRLHAIDLMFGDYETAAARLGELGGLVPAA
ncbi:MAG: acyl-CoA dehydrogenase family protein [Pseudomonadota bacterium]|jgi:alkylation response protein AidB-like acyl-CoA dehydrogenase